MENSGYKESLYNMMEVRKYIASQRIELKNKGMEGRREAEERMVMTEEWRVAAEERSSEVEEMKVAVEEFFNRMDNEHMIMFLDPSVLD